MSHADDPVATPTPVTHTVEVVPTSKKKRYTPAYKLRIIEEAERCTTSGELGAFLRKEGIYFSTLTDFRKQKARGDFDPQTAPRVSKTRLAPGDPTLEKQLAASEREVRKLRRELQRATALLDLQKKVSEVLGLTLEETD